MSDMDIKKCLQDFEFIKGMEKDHLDLMVKSMVRKKIQKGMVMFGNHGHCEGIPLVTSGNLRLFRVSESGREMTVYRVSAGEMCVLAAVCVLGDLEYEYSVEAETDCTIADIPPETFKQLLDYDRSFKSYVFNTLANKLISSLNTMENLNFKGIEERVYEYLEIHADKQGKIKATHEKIAIDLGSSREVISRQLKKMADQGLLIQKRGCIILNS